MQHGASEAELNEVAKGDHDIVNSTVAESLWIYQRKRLQNSWRQWNGFIQYLLCTTWTSAWWSKIIITASESNLEAVQFVPKSLQFVLSSYWWPLGSRQVHGHQCETSAVNLLYCLYPCAPTVTYSSGCCNRDYSIGHWQKRLRTSRSVINRGVCHNKSLHLNYNRFCFNTGVVWDNQREHRNLEGWSYKFLWSFRSLLADCNLGRVLPISLISMHVYVPTMWQC